MAKGDFGFWIDGYVPVRAFIRIEDAVSVEDAVNRYREQTQKAPETVEYRIKDETNRVLPKTFRGAVRIETSDTDALGSWPIDEGENVHAWQDKQR